MPLDAPFEPSLQALDMPASGGDSSQAGFPISRLAGCSGLG